MSRRADSCVLKSADLRELKGKVRKLFGEWGSQEEYRKRFRSQGFSLRAQMMPFLSERRIHLRYPAQKIVSYCYKNKRYLTLTQNVGLGGMMIKTHYRLFEGEHLNFDIVLGTNSIGLKGRTIYSRSLPGGQMVSGVQFLELSKQHRNMLRGYLATIERWPRDTRINRMVVAESILQPLDRDQSEFPSWGELEKGEGNS